MITQFMALCCWRFVRSIIHRDLPIETQKNTLDVTQLTDDELVNVLSVDNELHRIKLRKHITRLLKQVKR
jgi:hypothetical protein